MPTTLTRPKTASKKTIEELAERAQSIISKYDIPYTKNNQ